MAFTSLKDRLPNLPLILAGPILRKVTPSSVTVWLALKEAADVTLLIQKGELHPGQAMFGSPATSTISLGSNLHMVCVTARRKSGDPELTHGLVYQLLPRLSGCLTQGVEILPGWLGRGSERR